MEVFVARQPIFDTHESVVYYELLFRANGDNYYNSNDGDKATIEVMTNSFTLIGLPSLTEGKRAFINFTESLLLKGTPLLLPKDKVVIEILETVSPTRDLIECCKRLKSLGYILALDDFVFSYEYKPLLDIADIVKIDFLATKGKDRARIMRHAKDTNIKFLAEKVETREDFEEAVKLGYSLFQGYFFSRPIILSSKEIPSNRLYNFEIIKFIYEGIDDLDEIEDVIKKDVSLSYKLLKFINSASLGFRSNIQSIRQALVLMGKIELIKWITLVTLRSIVDKDNEILLSLAVIRAKFGESIAKIISLENRASEVFIMEMFSNIDVLLNTTMERAIVDLPISEETKAALLGEENVFRYINQLVLCYEKADWEAFSSYAKKLDINEDDVPSIYAEAVKWSTNFLETN